MSTGAPPPPPLHVPGPALGEGAQMRRRPSAAQTATMRRCRSCRGCRSRRRRSPSSTPPTRRTHASHVPRVKTSVVAAMVHRLISSRISYRHPSLQRTLTPSWTPSTALLRAMYSPRWAQRTRSAKARNQRSPSAAVRARATLSQRRPRSRALMYLLARGFRHR